MSAFDSGLTPTEEAEAVIAARREHIRGLPARPVRHLRPVFAAKPEGRCVVALEDICSDEETK